VGGVGGRREDFVSPKFLEPKFLGVFRSSPEGWTPGGANG